MVRVEGLEPSILAAADFKSAVYTVPPHSRCYPPLPVTFLTGLPTGAGCVVFLTDLEPLAGFASGCCVACFFSNADFTAVINEAMMFS